MIMTPTRELAIQVAEEIGKLPRYKGIRTLPIYGGQEIGRQIRALRQKPQIIIGTPGPAARPHQPQDDPAGRRPDVVLDEADEMLDMGFLEDIHDDSRA